MSKLLMFMPTTEKTHPNAPLRMVSQGGAVGSWDLVVTRDNPGPTEGDGRMENICRAYEKMRKIFLAGEYERVWILEHDIIPPKDALERMLSVDAPVVTALYAHRYHQSTPNLFKWDCGVPVLGLRWKWKDVADHWGERVQVTGGCQGCIMFDRSSMENFDFSLVPGRGPDWALMQYHTKNRFKQIACLDVVCGHQKESGDVIVPTGDERGFRIIPRDIYIEDMADPVRQPDFSKPIEA